MKIPVSENIGRGQAKIQRGAAFPVTRLPSGLQIWCDMGFLRVRGHRGQRSASSCSRTWSLPCNWVGSGEWVLAEEMWVLLGGLDPGNISSSYLHTFCPRHLLRNPKETWKALDSYRWKGENSRQHLPPAEEENPQAEAEFVCVTGKK